MQHWLKKFSNTFSMNAGLSTLADDELPVSYNDYPLNSEMIKAKEAIPSDYYHKNCNLVTEEFSSISINVADCISRLLEVKYSALPVSCRLIVNRVAEDINVYSIKSKKLIAAFNCFPSGWKPTEKIGRTFAGLHANIPGMIAMLNDKVVEKLLQKVMTGPLVRYAWGVQPNGKLNDYYQVGFRNVEPYIRVERQVLVPYPEDGFFIFLIRRYMIPFSKLQPSDENWYNNQVASMTSDQRKYKLGNLVVQQENDFLIND